MSQKWNLQDIRPAESRKKRRAEVTTKSPVATTAPKQSTISKDGDVKLRRAPSNRKPKSTIYLIGIILVILGIGVASSFLMQGAKVTVYPHFKEPNLNATFTAYKIPEEGELNYEIMTLEAEGERQVTATGKEEAFTQATGKILIYNTHQTKPIRLVTNTRFESPEGLIFKVKDSVMVPGYSVGPSGDIVPGVVTAEVYASEAGSEYNLPPTKFTIPGFKDYPEYETVYAESVENMAGGFSGEKFIIEENELSVVQESLREELRNSLKQRLDSELPADFIKFSNSETFTHQSLPAVESGDDQATIKEKVTVRVPLFAAKDFAKYIAAASVSGYEGNPVRIEDYANLNFSYDSATTTAQDISVLDSLTFKLVGKPTLIWEYEESKLKTDLLDANKTALPSILGGYPAIRSAEAVIRPFWKTKFPSATNKIEIIEVVERQS